MFRHIFIINILVSIQAEEGFDLNRNVPNKAFNISKFLSIVSVNISFKYINIYTTQQRLAGFIFFSFPTYQRERFENANISISPTFQETVGSHFKSGLPAVAMATLNQFISNIFTGFSEQYSTCNNITIHYYTHTRTVALTSLFHF